MTVVYNEENTSLTYSFSFGSRGGRNDSYTVPADVLDMLLDNNIHGHVLEELLWFRSISRKASEVRWTSLSELVGQDITGKVLYVWYADYEDSTWKDSAYVAKVTVNEHGVYEFVHTSEFLGFTEEEKYERYSDLENFFPSWDVQAVLVTP